jgi:hypothetical protein
MIDSVSPVIKSSLWFFGVITSTIHDTISNHMRLGICNQTHVFPSLEASMASTKILGSKQRSNLMGISQKWSDTFHKQHGIKEFFLVHTCTHLYACSIKEVKQYYNSNNHRCSCVSWNILWNKKNIPHKVTIVLLISVTSLDFHNNIHKYVLPIIHYSPSLWIIITIHGVHYYNNNKQ